MPSGPTQGYGPVRRLPPGPAEDGDLMSDSYHDLLTRLFRESQRALRRYVRRRGASRGTAEELVQEAFLRTYENAERLQTPRAFLFSTARNLTADARRQRRVRKTDMLEEVDVSGMVSPETSPEGQVLAEEESRILKEAIDRLPPQCRAVFVMKVFQACSYQEIAGRLGISPRTVENHIARALRKTDEYLRRRYR